MLKWISRKWCRYGHRYLPNLSGPSGWRLMKNTVGGRSYECRVCHRKWKG